MYGTLSVSLKRRVKMADYKGRCMKCQKEVGITGAEVVTTKNNRKMAKGTCGSGCGTTVCRFLPN